MGSLVGHALPGFGFIVIGLWQLFNHIKLHCLRPDSYYSPLWFPIGKVRYMELYLMMFGSAASVGMELFFGPAKHQPLDSDGTIPTYHLHNFEHSLMSATIFTYAVFAILFDKAGARTKIQARIQTGLAQLVGAVAFGQQLLLFRLHSADHAGVEGQYHALFQILICISLSTTLIGIAHPRSFIISFLRAACVVFQGIWLVVMGIMLWTPALSPKGCYLNFQEGHYVMRCRSDEALTRAKALVNIEFSWYVIGMTAFSMGLYLAIDKSYGKKSAGYQNSPPTLKEVELYKEEGESEDDSDSLFDMGDKSSLTTSDMERQ